MVATRSICRICANGCALLVEGGGPGEPLRVQGDPSNPLFAGYSCVKGRAQSAYLRDPDRVLRPLKRGADGRLAPIRLDRAITEVAEHLDRIVAEHGPRAVASYWGMFGGAPNTAAKPMLTAFMDALGSPLRFSPITIDKPGKPIAKALLGRWMAPPQGFDNPEAALLIGINPLVSHQGFPAGNPGRWLSERRRAGMRLIVIDPRRSDVARRADLYLQPRPGHDAAILASVVRTILERGLIDAEFLAQNASGVDQLKSAVAPFTPERVGAIAGLAPAAIDEASVAYAGARRAFAVAGTGAHMAGNGTLVEYLVLVLETICGRWLRAGERVRNPGVLMPQVPAKAQALGPTAAYEFGETMRARGLRASAAGLPVAALPDEMMLEGDGRVLALISVGGNPAAAWPDQARTVEALRRLDLLVQVDVWPSNTARLADYVFAAKMPLEMAATTQHLDGQALYSAGYGCTEAYAQYTPAVVEPPPGSEVVAEWELLFRLAAAMDLSLTVRTEYWGTVSEPVELDMTRLPTEDEMLDVVSAGSRLPLDAVRATPGGAFQGGEPLFVAQKDPGWEGRLDVGNPDMMDDLRRLASLPREGISADPDEPTFRLMCRRLAHVYNSSCNVLATNRGRAYNPAFLHPDDLAALGLASGDEVEISTDRARILAVVASDGNLLRSTVSMSHAFGGLPGDDVDPRSAGANTNLLTRFDGDLERYSGQPRMTDLEVRIRPLRR